MTLLKPWQRYYVLGGKCGVGKTTLAASLASHGEPTLIVSMDPNLGDSFEVTECLFYVHAT